MNWTVIWLDGPLDDLARQYVPLWGTPAGRAVTQAMARIDTLLQADPRVVGESRVGHRRILMEPPVTIDFEVYEDQGTVVVTGARYTPR
jgi:hypothetical protein